MQKLFWLDVETTGLIPKEDLILEVAAVITDRDLVVQDKFQMVANYSQVELDYTLDGYCRNLHTRNGLLTEVAASLFKIDEIDKALEEFAVYHFGPEKVKLTGNSVHFDDGFARHHMPRFASHLHYRRIDGSTLFELQLLYGLPTIKGEAPHRALPDLIEHSIPNFKQSLSTMGIFLPYQPKESHAQI